MAAAAFLFTGLFAAPAGALGARGVARAAAGSDPAIAAPCRQALAAGRPAAFCDRGRAPRAAVVHGTKGSTLRPGRTVTLRATRVSRRAQLVLVYRVAGHPVYVRFARFGRGGRVTARVASRVRGGRLAVRLRAGEHSYSPAHMLAIGATGGDDAPAGTSTAAPAQAPAAAPVAVAAPERTCGTLPDGGDATFNRMFASCGPGNTGADGGYSVPLPDGRVAWLFSDTFVGTLNDDGSRASSSFVRNSMAVQDGGRLTTLHGGTASAPDSMFASPGGTDWYWAGDGTVDGGKLRVFLNRFGATGGGMWDFAFKGSAVATLALPSLRVESIDPLPGTSRVAWGAAVLERDDYTYVYGVEDLGDEKYAHVARAPRGALGGPWQYFDGSGWSSDEAASARVTGGVSNAFSVVPAGQGVDLVTQAPAFGRAVTAQRAAAPAGPFGAPKPVATVADSRPGAYTYHALVHPEFSDGSGVLLSWNVNSSDPAEVLRDASLYRPRFTRVALPSD